MSHSVRHASVADAEGYRSSVRGVDIDAVRIGASDASNHVASVSDDHLTITAGRIGFPISHTANTPDTLLIVARIHSAPAGSRWAGIDLSANQTLLYSPGVEHVGVDLAGTCFTFVTTEIERVEQRADQLRCSLDRLAPGSVRDVTAIDDFSSVSSRLDPIETLREGSDLPGNVLDDLLSSIAVVLSRREARTGGPGGRPSVGRVIHRCIDYAHTVGRRPSVSELCLVAGVSETTLRDTFVSAFGMPPSVFFRNWALDRAHDRLVSGEPIPGGVSAVALETGFSHFGRFARYYREVFGELPSQTYRRHTGIERLQVDADGRRPTHKAP